MSHDTFNPSEITQAPICECGDECMREPGEGRACRFLVDYGPRSFTPNTDLSAEHEAARRKFRTMLLGTGDLDLRAAYYQTITLAEHEAARRQMATLASAIEKFAPELNARLVEKWKGAQGALADFLAVLRAEDEKRPIEQQL